MAESEHDDLADALSRMSGDEPPAPVRPPAVRPATVRPAAVKPVAPAVKPAAAVAPRVARPAAPAITPPPAPLAAPIPSTAPPVVTPRPQRPMAPVARPAAPVIAPPVEPESYDEEPANETRTDEETGIFDDGDSVIVPAPEASAFAPRTASVAARRAKAKQHQSLVFSRTLIPILLTVGVIFLVFGALRYTLGPESTLSLLPKVFSHLFIAAGAASLCMAVVMMFSVKKAIDAGAE